MSRNALIHKTRILPYVERTPMNQPDKEKVFKSQIEKPKKKVNDERDRIFFIK
jgi:hypothetical protein